MSDRNFRPIRSLTGRVRRSGARRSPAAPGASLAVERIGDRVTNIAERITYMTSGEFVHLGGGRKKRQRARAAAEASASGASGLA